MRQINEPDGQEVLLVSMHVTSIYCSIVLSTYATV